MVEERDEYPEAQKSEVIQQSQAQEDNHKSNQVSPQCPPPLVMILLKES
jgi:hypothetical protein